MTRKQLHIKLMSISILLVSIYSVTQFPAPRLNIITYFQNTTMWWLIIALIFYVFLSYNYSYIKRKDKDFSVVQLYLIWNVLSIFRGFFIADTYWDWKGLIGNGIGLLLPIVAVTANDKMVLQTLFSFYVKYALPLFLLMALIISYDAYGFYLVPISFFMLFFPVLTNPWRWVVGVLTFLVMTIDLGARSNVIKFGFPVFVMLIYYMRHYITVKYYEIVRLILIVIPVVLFSLAVSGLFNVFEMDNYVKGDYQAVERDENGNIVEDNLKNDTRSFLYTEVLYSAKVFNSWLIGRSPARGNLSVAFGDGDENGRGERLGNEVAILNVFTWTGIIGVVLYLIVFYRASYIAIHHSNNIYSKMLGLSVAFRWAYAWVEDINYFSLTYLFLWLTIGLCFSKSFRAMSDNEVKHWARGIFNIYNNKLSRKKIQEIRMKNVEKELSGNT